MFGSWKITLRIIKEPHDRSQILKLSVKAASIWELKRDFPLVRKFRLDIGNLLVRAYKLVQGMREFILDLISNVSEKFSFIL